MSEPKKIVLSGEQIVENEILDVSTTLCNSRYFLLTGTVYNTEKEPLKNVAIVVYEMVDSIIQNKKVLVGITFSIEDGTYGIPLLIGKSYILVAYF